MDSCDEEVDVQFLKEEVTEEAIYCVNLKKINFDVTNDLKIDDQKKARLQWKLEEQRVLKWGTLSKVVESMWLASGDLDLVFVDVLLATYRSFTCTAMLMQTIVEWYLKIKDDSGSKMDKDKLNRNLRKILLVWLDKYFDDFYEPPTFPNLNSLNSFVQLHFFGSDVALETNKRLDTCLLIAADEDDLTYGSMLDIVEWIWSLYPPIISPPIDIFNIPPLYLAQQLTFVDSKLFSNVQAHHCLGSIWSQRNDKKLPTSSRPYSVLATVEHFNAVSYRVISTILKWPYAGVANRTIVLDKWIGVAQECRRLKNFSSLKAIIAGLQSNPVFRLKKVWQALPRERMEVYHELACIFNEENNQALLREILNKEGTAKCVEMAFSNNNNNNNNLINNNNNNNNNLINNRLWNRKMMMMNVDKMSGFTSDAIQLADPDLAINQSQPLFHGTIPYLGTFLTDLTMLDTAFVDVDRESKMVNMEKKRREYEILVQIKILQSSSSSSSPPNYSIQPDPCFLDWFYSIRTYDDNESYELSLEIEPSNNSGTKEKNVKTHKRNVSLGYFTIRRRGSMDDGTMRNNNTSLAISDAYKKDDDRKSINSLREMAVLSKVVTQQLDTLSMISKCTSLNNLLTNQKPPSNPLPLTPLKTATTMYDQSNCIPVKVELIYNQSHDTNFYKTIMVSNVDHVSTVMKKILLKFQVEGANPDEFSLSQKLENNSEIHLPDRGNVFYAIKSSNDIRLVARPKNQKPTKDYRNKNRGSSVIANNRKLMQRTNKLSKLFSSMVSLIPSS